MELTKQEFESYLAVQKSGKTNMFNVPVVVSLSGLSREQVLYIMGHYSELVQQLGVK